MCSFSWKHNLKKLVPNAKEMYYIKLHFTPTLLLFKLKSRRGIKIKRKPQDRTIQYLIIGVVLLFFYDSYSITVIQWSLTYPYTMVPKLTARITEFTVK